VRQVWVDSLNPEYLENALADVVGDIMGALWGLLRPSQPLRSHAMAAMQLLGKLGERCGAAYVLGFNFVVR
jgi:transformation/transcription domain-associated protein